MSSSRTPNAQKCYRIEGMYISSERKSDAAIFARKYRKSQMCDARGSVATLRSENYPLGTPAGVAVPVCAVASPHKHENKSEQAANNQLKGYGMTSGVGALLIWFVVIFIITWLLLYGIKPNIVMNTETGEVDMGKLLLWSFVISLLLIIIVWLIKVFTSKK